MKSALAGWTERNRQEAARELIAELEEFSYDGLTLLRDDLLAGRVVRGSWAGCVISYKRGTAGSTRRDRVGRARNPFTVMWDGGWFTDEEVLAAVTRELVRRSTPIPEEASIRPADAPAGAAPKASAGSSPRRDPGRPPTHR